MDFLVNKPFNKFKKGDKLDVRLNISQIHLGKLCFEINDLNFNVDFIGNLYQKDVLNILINYFKLKDKDIEA